MHPAVRLTGLFCGNIYGKALIGRSGTREDLLSTALHIGDIIIVIIGAEMEKVEILHMALFSDGCSLFPRTVAPCAVSGEIVPVKMTVMDECICILA